MADPAPALGLQPLERGSVTPKVAGSSPVDPSSLPGLVFALSASDVVARAGYLQVLLTARIKAPGVYIQEHDESHQ